MSVSEDIGWCIVIRIEVVISLKLILGCATPISPPSIKNLLALLALSLSLSHGVPGHHTTRQAYQPNIPSAPLIILSQPGSAWKILAWDVQLLARANERAQNGFEHGLKIRVAIVKRVKKSATSCFNCDAESLPSDQLADFHAAKVDSITLSSRIINGPGLWAADLWTVEEANTNTLSKMPRPRIQRHGQWDRSAQNFDAYKDHRIVEGKTGVIFGRFSPCSREVFEICLTYKDLDPGSVTELLFPNPGLPQRRTTLTLALPKSSIDVTTFRSHRIGSRRPGQRHFHTSIPISSQNSYPMSLHDWGRVFSTYHVRFAHIHSERVVVSLNFSIDGRVSEFNVLALTFHLIFSCDHCSTKKNGNCFQRIQSNKAAGLTGFLGVDLGALGSVSILESVRVLKGEINSIIFPQCTLCPDSEFLVAGSSTSFAFSVSLNKSLYRLSGRRPTIYHQSSVGMSQSTCRVKTFRVPANVVETLIVQGISRSSV
ncbi:uncharacterized protein BDR25DRAFT_356314 [Lindgomyces ingoldianus]|uniref:Uncharacterized protein n=1 Tax=Lindgomyces ingoldianus TaxID=673940 RepID=A0ACB6QU20_9PLEO|nr:uncharacterized protein BDR25DRAFT_356314 [Lindgomyces ingoldianus]KAF2469582.1 hypothetical protein BDR25DRAFT_356314 [Lindgomyces ingoldianus]